VRLSRDPLSNHAVRSLTSIPCAKSALEENEPLGDRALTEARKYCRLESNAAVWVAEMKHGRNENAVRSTCFSPMRQLGAISLARASPKLTRMGLRHNRSRSLFSRNCVGNCLRRFQAHPQCRSLAPVAGEAECAQVTKVAFTAAFDHRHNVVGIPQATPVEAPEPPAAEQPQTVSAARALQLGIGRRGVSAARRANAAIALPDLIAQVSRIGAQAPLVDAPLRTKRVSPARNLKPAPAAKRPLVLAFFE
jgi:hypothetical protein